MFVLNENLGEKMKINKTEKLLTILKDDRKKRYIPAIELANLLDVSTRQIRNYVVKINEDSNEEMILSCNKGYRLDFDAYARYQEKAEDLMIETPETRKNYIIQKLISSKNGYDVFDFAEELYMSMAAIENDLKQIRLLLKDCQLQLKRDKTNLKLTGSEKAKRTLMSHLITSESYDNFILKDEVQILTFHYHFWDFRKTILDIFAENDIFANDYTLNNTALHLIVMIDRIRNDCIMKDPVDLDLVKNTQQYLVSKQIQEYIENSYHVKINDTELYNLILIISNHTTIMDYSFITPQNINEYIEQKYVDIAHKVILSVEQCYFLDAFDEEFITKFTIHVKNMFERVNHDYYAKNPLTAKIKTTYPLIFDIAVFIAQEFRRDYQISLNEDEIAFIAFHIGSYFENNVQSKNKVTCAFVYADYYSIHKNVLDKIIHQFSQRIQMKYAVSINHYQPNLVHADLVISMVDMPFSMDHVILNPFLIDKDLRNIQEAIDRIALKKRSKSLKAYLMNFFNETLFYKNLDFPDKETAIKKLSQDVISLGFADDSLSKDVLAREQMSSTAFQDVAVPHSLSKNAKSSFISIALSEKGIQWDNNLVHIVALIGVNEDSRKMFSEVFDELVDILSEPANVKRLIASNDFTSFIMNIMKMMDKS